MLKIKNICNKRLRDKLPISHFDLLEIASPQLRYYYEEVRRTTYRLLDREKIMVDDSFKKFFIVNETLMAFIAKGNHVKEVLDNFPNHYMRFNFQGPS
jgi:hypothetical protein